ncbi:MAG: hypothetical protein WA978_04860 [Sphingopyxis granuli]
MVLRRARSALFFATIALSLLAAPCRTHGATEHFDRQETNQDHCLRGKVDGGEDLVIVGRANVQPPAERLKAPRYRIMRDGGRGSEDIVATDPVATTFGPAERFWRSRRVPAADRDDFSVVLLP